MSNEDRKQFTLIKNIIAKNIEITLPDHSKQFHVYIDASNRIIAGVLMQEKDKSLRTISGFQEHY